MSGQRHGAAALHPGKTWYRLGLRSCLDVSGKEKIVLPLLRLEPQTVQTIANRCKDWFIYIQYSEVM